MELVLLESTLVPLPVLEVLCALTVEHTVVPVALVLTIASLAIEHTPATLHTISEFALVPTAVTPPEGPSTIALSGLEFPLIDVTLFASPIIDASSFLFIEAELADVVITGGEVEFSLSLKLSIVELTTDDLVGTLEEADALAVGAVYLRLTNVDDLCVLEELGVVEGRFHA